MFYTVNVMSGRKKEKLQTFLLVNKLPNRACFQDDSQNNWETDLFPSYHVTKSYSLDTLIEWCHSNIFKIKSFFDTFKLFWKKK